MKQKRKKREKREKEENPLQHSHHIYCFEKVVRRQGMISSPPTLAPVRRNLRIPILTRGWQETVAFLLDEIEPQPPHPTRVLVALNVYIQIITGLEHAVQEPKGERPGDQGCKTWPLGIARTGGGERELVKRILGWMMEGAGARWKEEEKSRGSTEEIGRAGARWMKEGES